MTNPQTTEKLQEEHKIFEQAVIDISFMTKEQKAFNRACRALEDVENLHRVVK